MTKTWMVRAKKGGRLFDVFKEKSVVAIGWTDIGSLDPLDTREAIAARVAEEWPDWHPQKVAISAGQLYRFKNEMQAGDRVVTYDPSRRVYLLGTISGAYRYDEEIAEDSFNARSVEWDGEISRDALRIATKNSLGAISALFLIPDSAAADLERALSENSGSASAPDGFGFESPRIVVEVKHRKQTMGSQDIRAFLGGRRADDKGLYVSTGGFTKEAHYEAERATIPMVLMDIDDLVEAILDHYEELDIETKQLLPLRSIYWPA